MSVFDETGAKMISATRRIFYMQNLKPSELDVTTSVFDEPGVKMISSTRRMLFGGLHRRVSFRMNWQVSAWQRGWKKEKLGCQPSVISSWVHFPLGAPHARGNKNWHVNLHELVNRRNTKKQPKKNLNTDQGHEGGHIYIYIYMWVE